MPGVTKNDTARGHSYQKHDLQALARRAMEKRDLLADFGPEVLAETDELARKGAPLDPSLLDLRSLLWASIDNDDSRDLDQLSVAEAVAGGAVKILVAIADVDFARAKTR